MTKKHAKQLPSMQSIKCSNFQSIPLHFLLMLFVKVYGLPSKLLITDQIAARSKFAQLYGRYKCNQVSQYRKKSLENLEILEK